MPSPPLATYRLQLHPGFTFDDAAAVAGYLADLGVSHVYLSPVLQAAPGSTHGYDVVDHSRPSAALGGEAGYRRLGDALGAAGLGQVLDIVPNHMAIGARENRWWWDVLENGPSSLWAGHFDVTWDPPEEKLRNTVLLPILGDHYGRVLDRGEVRLEHERGEFTVRYHEHVFPVSLRSLAGHIARAAERAGSDDLAFVATALRRLPAATRTDRASRLERHRDTAVLRRQLVHLMDHDERSERHTGVPGEAVRTAIEEVVAEVNADVDALDTLLEDQNYRIAHWRTAGRELGYRRFFDINSLVGVRVEDPEVFADTHGLVLRWLREGVVDGLRVDHPDGLRDPERYFRRLAEAGPGAWIVAEKILEVGEELPPSWPVAGTTGYDRLAAIDGVLVDPAGEAPLTEAYGRLTGADTDWVEVRREAKALAVRQILGADVARLTAQLVEVCEGRRHQRDRTRHELAEALRELLTSFPVYRSYVRVDDEADDPGASAGGGADAPVAVAVVRPDDVAHVEAALADVARRCPEIDPDLLAFLGDLLLLRLPGLTALERDFALQFQQLTGPAMAKGVEDTAFYRYTRLLALNEVGGDPGRFGVSVERMHAANAERAERHPRGMLTLQTHDTKRGPDVRARIGALAGIAEEWAGAVRRWRELNEPLRRGGAPDGGEEHLIYQTMLGAWPLSADRLVQYLEKALREEKTHT
ncbi:MAG TPA: malto-oligosyltrehalose synthase, partial [Acidimicrobiales bacterium]